MRTDPLCQVSLSGYHKYFSENDHDIDILTLFLEALIELIDQESPFYNDTETINLTREVKLAPEIQDKLPDKYLVSFKFDSISFVEWLEECENEYRMEEMINKIVLCIEKYYNEKVDEYLSIIRKSGSHLIQVLLQNSKTELNLDITERLNEKYGRVLTPEIMFFFKALLGDDYPNYIKIHVSSLLINEFVKLIVKLNIFRKREIMYSSDKKKEFSKTERNNFCPCGSGKKYIKCCFTRLN